MVCWNTNLKTCNNGKKDLKKDGSNGIKLIVEPVELKFYLNPLNFKDSMENAHVQQNVVNIFGVLWDGGILWILELINDSNNQQKHILKIIKIITVQ